MALERQASHRNIRSPNLSMEREGRRKLLEIINAVYGESWSLNLLIIALTAGPITYVGLQAGYYIGYGKFAGHDLFIYFAAYTLVYGLFSIGLRLFDTIVRNRSRRNAQHHINILMEHLPNLIKLAQDMRLSSLTEDERTQEAALIVLKNSHISIDSLEIAVFDLTGNPALSNAIKKIEIYRRAGLPTVVRDVVNEVYDEIHESVSKLREERPDIADWLEMRLLGNAPALEEGLKRSEGFIERILHWMETFNDDLLRSRDIEELFILVFELLCDREIPLLKIRYKGMNQISIAATRLDKARNTYRIAHAARFSRLKALERYLGDIEELDIEIQPYQKDVSLLLADINKHMNALCDITNKLINGWSMSQGRKKTKIRVMLRHLTTALSLYKELMVAHRDVERHRQAMKAALERWDGLVDQNETNVLNPEDRKILNFESGLTISERMIRLNDAEKITLARKLSGTILKFFGAYGPILMDPTTEAISKRLNSARDEIKKMVVETMEALEPLIFISKADTQRAIEYSNAPNFGGIEPGYSLFTKAAWGTAATQEVEDNLAVMSERLFRAMISQYGVDPGEETISLLTETYGARENILNHTRENVPLGPNMPKLSAPEKMKTKPVMQPAWQQTLDRARNFL